MIRFCVVWRALRIRDNHEMGRQGREPFPSRCHHDSGNNKAASLLLLSFAKLSNTKDMLNIGRPARGYCEVTLGVIPVSLRSFAYDAHSRCHSLVWLRRDGDTSFNPFLTGRETKPGARASP